MDSTNSGFASRPPEPRRSRRIGDLLSGSPTAHHAFRRLQTRQQFQPLLIITTVFTLLIVIATGYIAARANAISAAQTDAANDAQIAREVIAERGQFPAVVNNQLVAATGTNTYSLVNDTWVVDHVRQVTGNLAVIYQLSDTSALVAVSSNIPQTDSQGHPLANSRAIGQQIPSEAQAALLDVCSPQSVNTACRGFSGVVTLAGVSYVAGFAPLLDQNGRLVGAVGVLNPLDTVLTAPAQLAFVLLMMGLLVGLIVLVVGTWIAGNFPNRLLGQLDTQLDTMAHAAVELGRLAHQQQYRIQQQQRTARHVGDYAQKLEALATEMDNGQLALHQTTTAIWEEMSQPGIAINAATALRLAREAAVRASEVGVTGDATRAHARQVIALMNRVLAEGRALAQEGQAAALHANDLAATLDHMETELGEQLTPRRYDLGSAPLVRRIVNASQHLREMLRPDESAETPGTRPRPTGRPLPRDDAPMAHGGLSNLPAHDSTGRFPSASFRGNDSLSGFPHPANPDISGSRHGGWRPSGDASQPPGGLPPLGFLDDDIPPRKPNDSRWLNE